MRRSLSILYPALAAAGPAVLSFHFISVSNCENNSTPSAPASAPGSQPKPHVGLPHVTTHGGSIAGSTTGKVVSARSHALSEGSYQVAQKLKAGLHDKSRTFLGETKEGLKRYRMFQAYSSSINNTGFVKVGSIEIKDSVENICQLWENQANRQDWDKGVVVESKEIKDFEDNLRINYIVCKSSIAPWRDFAFISDKSDAALAEITNFNAVLYVNQDASKLVPTSWRMIRGTINSLLLIEPIGYKKCRVSYVTSMNPNGWTWLLPYSTVNSILGDNILNTLVNMKNHLEKGDFENDPNLTIDEIARRKVMKKIEKEKENEKKVSILDEVNTFASVEDMEATVRLLESRLQKLRESGPGFEELKSRVESDLAKAKEQLRRRKAQK